MLSRLTVLWSCLAVLCVGCTLDRSPRRQPGADDDSTNAGSWKPRGASGSGRRVSAETEDTADAAKNTVNDAAQRDPQADAAPSGPAGGASANGSNPTSPASNAQDAAAPATPNAPTAGDVSPAPEDPSDPSTPSAGTGGVAGDQAGGGAGSAGAAGSGGENSRQSLIDAALEALGGGEYPWRNGGSDGIGLSAEFVKNILYSLVASGTCFRDTRSCIQACFVIASDCKPCAADAECADALMRVCGPLGTCSP